MENLKSYFEIQLPQEDVQPLVECFSVVKLLKKGEKLVVPGQSTLFLSFINTGAFRVFFVNNKGHEVTSWFSFSGMFVTDLLSYYTDSTATQYIEAIEDSELFIAQKSQLEELYIKKPKYQQFARRFAERGMVMIMERMKSLQSKTGEERYLELLAQPQFMEKIPLKYLATYLGITDTSLSRIRKTIS